MNELIKENEFKDTYNKENPGQIIVTVKDKKKHDTGENNSIVDGIYRKLINFEESKYIFYPRLIRVDECNLIIYKSIDLPEPDTLLQKFGIDMDQFYIFYNNSRLVIAISEYDINNKVCFKIIGFISRNFDSKVPIDIEGDFQVVLSLDTFKLQYKFDGKIDFDSISTFLQKKNTKEIKDIEISIKLSDYIKKIQEVPDKYIDIRGIHEQLHSVIDEYDEIQIIKKIIFLNKENYLEIIDREKKPILPNFLNFVFEISCKEDYYSGTYIYQKIDIDFNPYKKYKNNFYGYRNVKNKNFVIILYPILYELTYQITWVVFDLFNTEIINFQKVDNINTYSVSLDLKDGEGEKNYYFNKLITNWNHTLANWSNSGMIRNQEYSIYKYKITSLEFLKPNNWNIYRDDDYIKLLENNNLIDISSPNYFLKKIIEINSEELKNFPEKIKIVEEEFEYQEIEIIGNTIFGYLNQGEDKIIIFIPTIIYGKSIQNHLFVCHKFTHENGKEMLVKKLIFPNSNYDFIYPPQSADKTNNYLFSLDTIIPYSYDTATPYSYDTATVINKPECENPPEIKEKNRLKRKKQVLRKYFSKFDNKYVLKPITDLPEIINCEWYKSFIKILFFGPVTTMAIFENYIIETGNILKKDTTENRKMFQNFFGFDFEKAASIINLYNSFFIYIYISFNGVIAGNKSVFFKDDNITPQEKIEENFLSKINSLDSNLIHTLRKNNLEKQFLDGIIDNFKIIYEFFGKEVKPKTEWRSRWGSDRIITPIKPLEIAVEEDEDVDEIMLNLTEMQRIDEKPNEYIYQYLSKIFMKNMNKTIKYINNVKNVGNLERYMKNRQIGKVEFTGNSRAGMDYGGLRPAFFCRQNNSVMGDFLNNIFQTFEQNSLIENYFYEHGERMLKRFEKREHVSISRKKFNTKKRMSLNYENRNNSPGMSLNSENRNNLPGMPKILVLEKIKKGLVDELEQIDKKLKTKKKNKGKGNMKTKMKRFFQFNKKTKKKKKQLEKDIEYLQEKIRVLAEKNRIRFNRSALKTKTQKKKKKRKNIYMKKTRTMEFSSPSSQQGVVINSHSYNSSDNQITSPHSSDLDPPANTGSYQNNGPVPRSRGNINIGGGSLPADMKLMTRTHMNLEEKDIAKVNNQNIIFGLVSNNKLLNENTNKYNFYFITGMLLAKMITNDNGLDEKLNPVIYNVLFSYQLAQSLVSLNIESLEFILNWRTIFNFMANDDPEFYKNTIETVDFSNEEEMKFYLDLQKENFEEPQYKKYKGFFDHITLNKINALYALYYVKFLNIYFKELRALFTFCKGFQSMFNTSSFNEPISSPDGPEGKGTIRRLINKNVIIGTDKLLAENLIFAFIGKFDKEKFIQKLKFIYPAMGMETTTRIKEDKQKILEESFKKIINGMNEDTIKKLLYFFTGTPGFIDSPNRDYYIVFNNGEFGLNEPDLSQDSDKKLPIAHTCFNQLVLPNYSKDKITKENIMEKKLLLAIEYGDGFGFA